jgi:hypothetical protein
LIQS